MMPRITTADLFIAAAIAIILVAFTAAAIALIDAPERGASQEREAHAHVMRLKHGNTWPAQVIRARLIVVRKLIQAADPGHVPALGDAMRRQYPLTSPATSPPASPPAGAEPGDEAAAGESLAPIYRPPLPPGPIAAAAGALTPPGAAPPPLPDAIVTYDHDPAEIAAAAPWAVPFKAWESDTFVGRVEAIRGHGGTAGMEAEI